MNEKNFLNWRDNNYIPIVSKNVNRKKFIANNWIEFQSLFFKPIKISKENFNAWLKKHPGNIKKWFSENPKTVKIYYIESRICELIRNRRYITKTKENAELKRKSLISNATQSELHLKQYLDKNKIAYKFQEIIYIKDEFGIISNYYIADFLINNTVIEVDGGYHLKKKQIVKDKIRTNEIEKMGYRVIRITNEDVSNFFKEMAL